MSEHKPGYLLQLEEIIHSEGLQFEAALTKLCDKLTEEAYLAGVSAYGAMSAKADTLSEKLVNIH